MDKSDFTRMVGVVQKENGSAYGTKAVIGAWEKVAHCDGTALFKAVDKVVLAHTTLPPLQRLIDATINEQAKLDHDRIAKREEEAREDKAEFEKKTRQAFSAPGISRDSVLLVRALLAGKLTRGQYLDGIRHLDSLYPSAGFHIVGNNLTEHYAARGKDLNERPTQVSLESL